MKLRLALIASLAASPLMAADSPEQSCGYQAEIVAAVQQARKDRVKERDVPEAIAATDPEWPENYSAAIPLVTPWVYEQKMKIIRNEDLSEAWKELCLAQIKG